MVIARPSLDIPHPGVVARTWRERLDLEDEQLVAQMANGDRSALATLYDRYGNLMLGVALRILPDRQTAEDLVHDVFLEAWRSSEDYDSGRGSVRAWLLIRLRSRALDRRRSGHFSRRSTLEDRPELVEIPEEDPGLSPDRRTLRDTLLALPPEQRKVLELGYFEGLSSAEIAAELGIPIGTVKSRVAAALTRLRGVMGGTS